jgi:hypothetical protein
MRKIFTRRKPLVLARFAPMDEVSVGGWSGSEWPKSRGGVLGEGARIDETQWSAYETLPFRLAVETTE